MKKVLILSLIVCVAAAAVAEVSPVDVLWRKSIFARDRVSRMPTTGASTQPTSMPVTLPVLVGVLREDDGFVAVFEYSGRLTTSRMGQLLPGDYGIVTNIDLEHVEFAASTTQPSRRVLIGRNIEGSEAAILPAAATTDPASAIEGDDLVSRMRRRRLQETGAKTPN